MTCWRTRFEVRSELDEHLRCHAFTLADEAQQNVLGPDVVVPQLQRFTQRELKNLLGPRGKGDVSGRGLLALPDNLLDLFADGTQRNAQGFKGLSGNAFALMNEPKQDVLGADVVVVEHACLFLGKHDNATGTVGKSFKHEAHS